jgi:hypothetical protein
MRIPNLISSKFISIATYAITSNGSSNRGINLLYFWYEFRSTNKSSWYFLLIVLFFAKNISSLLRVNIFLICSAFMLRLIVG